MIKYDTKFKINLRKLSKDQIIALFELCALVCEEKELITLEEAREIMNVSDSDFEAISSYFVFEHDKIKLGETFSYFRNNAENVRKFREKKKEPKIEIKEIEKIEVIEKPKKEIVHLDYDRILVGFNKVFEGTVVPGLIKLSDDRKKKIKKCFDSNAYKEEHKKNPLLFFAEYYKHLKNETKIPEGWLNTTSGTWYKPDFDFIHKVSDRSNTYAKYMDNIKE